MKELVRALPSALRITGSGCGVTPLGGSLPRWPLMRLASTSDRAAAVIVRKWDSYWLTRQLLAGS